MEINRRVAREAGFKLQAIEIALKEGNRAAARKLGVTESMVRRWRTQSDQLRQCKTTTKAFRGPKGRWPELENVLADWVREQRADGRHVTTLQIRLKAQNLANERTIEGFKGGESWCFRFMKRKKLFTYSHNSLHQQQLQPDPQRETGENCGGVMNLNMSESSMDSTCDYTLMNFSGQTLYQHLYPEPKEEYNVINDIKIKTEEDDVEASMYYTHDYTPMAPSGDTLPPGQEGEQSMVTNHIEYKTEEDSIELDEFQRASLALTTTNLTDNILHFLIMDLQPPSLIKGKGFQYLMNTILPQKQDLPSKSKLDLLLHDLHEKGKLNVAHMLRTKADMDYTAPLETERNRRLKHVPHLVNFSVDVWFHTWQGNTEMYLTLWAHYIDASFACHNRALVSQKVSKSGLNLKAVEAQVKALAEEWGISRANLTVLGGEGWNDIRAIPMMSNTSGEASRSTTPPNSTTFLEREDSTSSPMEQENGVENQPTEDLPSVPCFFTAMQSCIDELISMNAVSKVMTKFQTIIGELFMESIQTGGSSETFADHFLQGMTSEEQVEMKMWVHNRPTWNKLYLILNTILKYKTLLRDILIKRKEDTSSAPSENTAANGQSLRNEWKVVEDLCLVLKPLDVACQTLAKEEFPRLSLIKPILTGLLSRHLVARPGDSSILKDAKIMMRYNLSHWYDTPAVNRVLNVACALDPQFHGLCFMSEKEQVETYKWLKSEAVRISNESQSKKHAKQHAPNDDKRSPSPSTPDEDSRRRSKRLKESEPINFRAIADDSEGSDVDHNDSDWVEPSSGLSGMEFLLGDLYSPGNKSKQKSVEESVELEINVYRSDNAASPGVDPLQWWRSKTMQLPLLAAVAQAYLASPAVAGNVTQGYLQEGLEMVRGKRSNIPPENLDAILFLHHNKMHKTKFKAY